MMQTFEEKQRALQAAIEELYVAFSSYRPLRKIANEETENAGTILFDAMCFGDDDRDFKHILPLILKLLTWGESYPVDAEMLSRKLNCAQWQMWPDEEKNAIENFLLALWNYDLAGGSTGDSTESWFDAISQVVEDASPFLQMWENEYSIEACEALRDFIEDFYSWSRAPQVGKWLRSDELLQLFEQRFFDSENEGQAKLFSQIVDALTNFRYIAKVRGTNETPNPN